MATLDILVREFAEQIGIAVHRDLSPLELEPSVDRVIFRVMQEAITNTTKDARARNVWISPGAKNGQVHLNVQDDGIGFDMAAQPRSAHGLTGMRFRVESEGGSLEIVASPGEGTSIRVTLPELAKGKNKKME